MMKADLIYRPRISVNRYCERYYNKLAEYNLKKVTIVQNIKEFVGGILARYPTEFRSSRMLIVYEDDEEEYDCVETFMFITYLLRIKDKGDICIKANPFLGRVSKARNNWTSNVRRKRRGNDLPVSIFVPFYTLCIH